MVLAGTVFPDCDPQGFKPVLYLTCQPENPSNIGFPSNGQPSEEETLQAKPGGRRSPIARSWSLHDIRF